MKFIRKIKEFLDSRFGIFYLGPVLKDIYNISDNTELLATLTAYYPDEFWCDFLLTPIMIDPNKLELLYSQKF